MSSSFPPPPPEQPQQPEQPGQPEGFAPPPPPPGGYGAPPTPGDGWQLGDALSYGWNKFTANAGQILLSALVLLIGLAVVGGIGFGITAALTSDPSCAFDDNGQFTCDAGSGFIVRLILQSLVSAMLLIAAQVIGAGLVRASLNVTDGGTFQFADVVRTDKIAKVVVASLIIAAATFVGTILCYLPGLIVGFATSYTLYFIVDKDLEPVEAIKASVNLVKDNLANTIVWYLVGGIVAAIGFVVCGVGALVSVPVVLLGTAYTYKRLTGQPVAA